MTMYENAMDSLRTGVEHFRAHSPGYASRKRAIQDVYHAVELLLKQRLEDSDPTLIYRNKIGPDTPTVGVREAFTRLEDLGCNMPAEERATIERLGAVRNRIEHHKYDHNESDDAIIGASLKLILYFAEFELGRKLEDDIGQELFGEIQNRVLEYNEHNHLAEHRLMEWMKEKWSSFDPHLADTPDEFEGTHECPKCGEDWLVIGYHDKPFCFRCNTSVDAECCEDCGRTFFSSAGCDCDQYADPE